MEKINKQLTLHIILQQPPANVAFGLQKGSGSKYETVQIQRSGTQDLHFELMVEVGGHRDKDTHPRFRGPFA